MGFVHHCQDITFAQLCLSVCYILLPLFTAAACCHLSTGKLTSHGLPSLLTCCHSLCHLTLSVPCIMNSDHPFAQHELVLCYDTTNGTLMLADYMLMLPSRSSLSALLQCCHSCLPSTFPFCHHEFSFDWPYLFMLPMYLYTLCGPHLPTFAGPELTFKLPASSWSHYSLRPMRLDMCSI